MNKIALTCMMIMMGSLNNVLKLLTVVLAITIAVELLVVTDLNYLSMKPSNNSQTETDQAVPTGNLLDKRILFLAKRVSFEQHEFLLNKLAIINDYDSYQANFETAYSGIVEEFKTEPGRIGGNGYYVDYQILIVLSNPNDSQKIQFYYSKPDLQTLEFYAQKDQKPGKLNDASLLIGDRVEIKETYDLKSQKALKTTVVKL